MINQLLSNFLLERKEKGLYRQRNEFVSNKIVQTNQAKCVLNFSSNDYLSLSEDLRIRKAYQKGFEKYPCGSGGSMVISGYHPIHKTLEKAFCKALGTDDALLFSSGYAANLGIIALLSKVKACLFLDKSLHASFYDGVQLTPTEYFRFFHNDFEDLHKKLLKNNERPGVVITEGIFSMSGEAPSLAELIKVCNPTQATLLVDEAHSFAILGPKGLGAVPHANLSQEDVPLRVIPFGKAFCAQGAIVTGKAAWINALLQTAKSYIYSTGISPALAYGLLETLELLQNAEDKRQKLFQLISYFQSLILQSPLTWRFSQTPIQQLKLGCPHKALIFSEALKMKGIFCQAIREPTVTKPDTGLRIILNCAHDFSSLDFLFSQLHQIHEEL